MFILVPETEPPSTTTPVYEGCEVSDFGCCFDNVTEALGPDQQGCPCDTYEFGCCLDGVTPGKSFLNINAGRVTLRHSLQVRWQSYADLMHIGLTSRRLL